MGGPWYSEQEFDVAFVEAISQFVGKVLAEEVFIVQFILPSSSSRMGWILKKFTVVLRSAIFLVSISSFAILIL